MSFELIAIDLDDTLLTSSKVISSKNKMMIQQALSQGIKVVLCSGRPHPAMENYAAQLGITGPDQYMITNGGALIENMNGEFILQNTLSNDFYREFVKFAEDNGFPYCVFDINGQIYTSNNQKIDSYTVSMAFESRDSIYIKQPDDLPNDFEITKAVITTDGPRLDEITEFVNQQYHDYFVVRTGIGYLEIFPKNVNKGTAVTYLADHLNIDLKNVMTIGDRDNDIPMLKIAGNGVAMANATEGSKAVCDYITTDNNHDGVGLAIAKFI